MVPVGIEPKTFHNYKLCVLAFIHYGTEIMFAVGIEPTTYRLEVCCSIQMS